MNELNNLHFNALDQREQTAVLAVLETMRHNSTRSSRTCSPVLLSHTQLVVEAELSANATEKRSALTALAAFACAELAKLSP